ncbi:dihydrolipoamide dehydrogenase [Variovorax paradoxus]|jgi:dihydrolipoamide dehydrogenase|uniref:dihydrolipoyl dehydrogenase n=1 Tax=Variovorax paradoxus TaxID=34073 RepID=UPI0006E503E7|nr:dihydrolipoamide dehydrogenase [Variovorax paradoxus]KPU95645.1 dihydrolipoamide dehydrogenase [Variovorax paradoxus]KPV09078.1 dihydrolipoamide dehydrogenase [Variovorax paradoxus]KPV22931.1 dihydrolipoamide dehydrogenase [Variovorax paradoxus]KPV33907.1 dihydrolipoamide dehydrogenase [Variovorax paradoxus]
MTQEQALDVLVIGAGSGGYIASIRAGQLGLKVACVEANPYADPKGEPRPGGTCLNIGCIPSKALLSSSEEFEKIEKHAAAHGIRVAGATMDVPAMIARKDAIVTKMAQGIEYLFRKNKVAYLKGRATILGRAEDGFRVSISRSGSIEEVTARNLVIATGSLPRQLPGIEVDNVDVCDNAGALDWRSVPRRMVIIGAGVIGLELGSVWRRLGAQVTVIEALPQLLPMCDADVAREMLKLLMAQGMDFRFGARVTGLERTKDGSLGLAYVDANGAAQSLECDKLVVAVGRVPTSSGLGLETLGVKITQRGFVDVDAHCRTSIDGVYAIGDVVRGPMLAHKAEDEGVMVMERIAGQAGHVSYDAIPSIIYTSPEVAWVGRTEQELKDAGIAYRAGKFPFTANGRALGNGDTSGFVKVVADQKTDAVLGVHIVSTYASEMIGEATMAIEFKASAEDIGRISHAHPTLYEAIREASLAIGTGALNL